MGYYIQSQKINIVLDNEQQNQIFNRWINPTEELKNNNKGFEWLERLVMTHRHCSNIKEIFNIINFKYKENEKGLELTYHSGNLRGQLDIFEAVADILKPNNFMSFMGEDGQFIGLFFNGKEVINYQSDVELEKLSSSFILKNDLDKELPEKNGLSQSKLKI